MKRDYRQVLVGGQPAAIMGLDGILAEAFEAGRAPDDPELGRALVAAARDRLNYIPRAAEDEFAQALAGEYRRYHAGRLAGQVPQPVDYGTWRGHPREHIPWFPTLAAELCDGCGKCLSFCSFGVFQATPDGRVAVVEPFKCQVGCSMCADICPLRAITFPPLSVLEAFRPGGH
jgi:NAD-dependent dihydropyrimidine dehydrogenase PreA subunit